MYESDPNGYVNAEHQWFDPKDAETKRTVDKDSFGSSFSVILAWNTYRLFILSDHKILYRKYFIHHLH